MFLEKHCKAFQCQLCGVTKIETKGSLQTGINVSEKEEKGKTEREKNIRMCGRDTQGQKRAFQMRLGDTAYK